MSCGICRDARVSVKEIMMKRNSYAKMQKEWVEENNLSVGDVVYTTSNWRVGQGGCNITPLPSSARKAIGDNPLRVRRINKENIEVVLGMYDAEFPQTFWVPYFALRKPNPQTAVRMPRKFEGKSLRLEWHDMEKDKPEVDAEVLFVWKYVPNKINSGYYTGRYFISEDEDGNVISRTENCFISYWAYISEILPKP